ncbi:MAG: type II toxin-antitoxin system VapC family toxin [Nitrospirales bacterium]|nr:type II toxin-antitoxin system VapC family toxin [Nitrospirales bacterium]
MVIDSSAVLAILNDEPERRIFNETIEKAEICLISAASFVEASIVLEARKGYEGVRDFDLFVARAEIKLAEVDAEQAEIARTAFRNFGKGRHAANLNFGDCFSYALAKANSLPLLFKGNDFSQTDVECAG